MKVHVETTKKFTFTFTVPEIIGEVTFNVAEELAEDAMRKVVRGLNTIQQDLEKSIGDLTFVVTTQEEVENKNKVRVIAKGQPTQEAVPSTDPKNYVPKPKQHKMNNPGFQPPGRGRESVD